MLGEGGGKRKECGASCKVTCRLTPVNVCTTVLSCRRQVPVYYTRVFDSITNVRMTNYI